MSTALIYAYKTKNAESFGLNSEMINLAYQINQPLAPYQCDFGKEMTANMLKKFKKEGGDVMVVNNEKELVLPLSEHKILVPVTLPVTRTLLQEWGLSDIIQN